MRQRRTDEPVHCTYILSKEADGLISRLVAHFTEKEQRRATRSEVVERAVRALAKKVNGKEK